MINYYGKFIKNLSTILAPLHNLLKKEIPFIWNDQCSKAFVKVKELLKSDQILTHFNPTLPIILSCDASQFGV